MKLRNKKTGEIADLTKRGLLRSEHTGNHIIVYPEGTLNYYAYSSLARFNEEWEDYKPTEPLIEDPKSRKLFREWSDLIGAERFLVNHLYNSGKGKTTSIGSTDLTTEPVIELPGHIGEDLEIYTKVELIGSEEE